MNITRISLATVATLLAIAYGTATTQAGPFRVDRGPAQSTDLVVKGGGGIKDTCTESNGDWQEQCDPDQLTDRCDDAGGGMSSLPGGGIDCDLGPE